MSRNVIHALACALLVSGGTSAATAQEVPAATRPDSKIQTSEQLNVVRPERVDATDERIAGLQVPEGFKIEVWARDLDKPRWFAAAGDGSLYVTSREAGTVVRLRDTDGDGKADDNQTVISDHPDIHGIYLDERRNQVFLVDIHTVFVAPLNDDGTFGEPEKIIEGLPDAGQHPNRTLAVGPDDMLYVSVGSLPNAAAPSDERESTMLRYDLYGRDMKVFAEGLRNTIGFGWHPETGEFWGMDHGIDWLGDDIPEEELNRLEEGNHYGHPWVWNDGNITPKNAQDPPEGFDTVAAFAETVEPPVLTTTAHSAPLQMAFNRGDALGDEYRNDAFVAMRGSWNRQSPSGYEIARIRFDDEGKPEAIEPFIGRWVSEDGSEHFGRLCGLAFLPDGSMLVGDDTNGVIYRVSRE